MEDIHELKKWIDLGFEKTPQIISILKRIEKIIEKEEKEKTKLLVNPFHKL
jgi:hypothetical protein